MKTITATALAAALTLIALPAFAQGNPAPTTTVHAGRYAHVAPAQMTPPTGAQAGVQFNFIDGEPIHY
ncbi:MAG: hypothetical protein WDO13_15870 [Verrucomicrobiota bacterium]